MKAADKSWLWLGPMLTLLVLTGCQWHGVPCVDKCADVEPGAIPQPLGTYVKEFTSRQTAKAHQDDFVIYLYEWQMGTPVFGPFGARHIDQLAQRLSHASSPFTVVIEPDDDHGLNEARRAAAVNYLQQRGAFVVSLANVTIGFPQAEGLYGDESIRIYQQMISPKTQNQSQIGASNNNISSSFGGGVGGSVGSVGVGGGVGDGFGGLGR